MSKQHFQSSIEPHYELVFGKVGTANKKLPTYIVNRLWSKFSMQYTLFMRVVKHPVHRYADYTLWVETPCLHLLHNNETICKIQHVILCCLWSTYIEIARKNCIKSHMRDRQQTTSAWKLQVPFFGQVGARDSKNPPQYSPTY